MENSIQLAAISGIKDFGKTRIVLYANGQLVHAPLSEILKVLEGKSQEKTEPSDAKQ